MRTNLFKTTFLFLSFILIFNSCSKDDVNDVETASLDGKIELSAKQLKGLEQNSLIPDGDEVRFQKGNFFGNNVEGIFVQDMFVELDRVNEWAENSDVDTGTNLSILRSRVRVPRNGSRQLVIGLPTGRSTADGLGTKQRNAAVDAIRRFRALNMNALRFRIVQGNNSQVRAANPDIVIFNDDNGGFVGPFDAFAQIPRNGNPGPLIGLRTSTRRTFTQTQLTVLIQHEIGHALGFPHADWRTLRSCANGGRDNVGALDVIPGTRASGNITNSIMRACNLRRVDNFMGEDRRSFRRAYNGRPF